MPIPTQSHREKELPVQNFFFFNPPVKTRMFLLQKPYDAIATPGKPANHPSIKDLIMSVSHKDPPHHKMIIPRSFDMAEKELLLTMQC